jgi:hypothetical protein
MLASQQPAAQPMQIHTPIIQQGIRFDNSMTTFSNGPKEKPLSGGRMRPPDNGL